MKSILHFVITKTDGTQVTQDIPCPPEAIDNTMKQVFAQYSQVGVLKQESGKFTLIPYSQIALVEIEPPSIVIAEPTEANRVVKAKETPTLKRIIS